MKTPTYETAECPHCRRQFKRLANVSRKRRCCYRWKCQAIAKLGREKPVSLDSIPNSGGSFFQQQNQYHGGFTT